MKMHYFFNGKNEIKIEYIKLNKFGLIRDNNSNFACTVDVLHQNVNLNMEINQFREREGQKLLYRKIIGYI